MSGQHQHQHQQHHNNHHHNHHRRHHSHRHHGHHGHHHPHPHPLFLTSFAFNLLYHSKTELSPAMFEAVYPFRCTSLSSCSCKLRAQFKTACSGRCRIITEKTDTIKKYSSIPIKNEGFYIVLVCFSGEKKREKMNDFPAMAMGRVDHLNTLLKPSWLSPHSPCFLPETLDVSKSVIFVR